MIRPSALAAGSGACHGFAISGILGHRARFASCILGLIPTVHSNIVTVKPPVAGFLANYEHATGGGKILLCMPLTNASILWIAQKALNPQKALRRMWTTVDKHDQAGQ